MTVWRAVSSSFVPPGTGPRTGNVEFLEGALAFLSGNDEIPAPAGTFVLVPPGVQGVGDKAGGWDEKSAGYDEKADTA